MSEKLIVFICFQVLALLLTLLGGRRIPERQLNIRIYEGRKSFFGTLLHELAHFFTFDEAESHGSQWQECSLQLMALINYYLSDIPVEDSGCHQLLHQGYRGKLLRTLCDWSSGDCLI